MKKFLSLLMALVMVLALAACGSDGNASNSPASDSPSQSSSGDSGSDAGYPTLKLNTASAYNATDMNGLIIQYFIDYIAEKSGGAIEIECYWGGSFCTGAEVWNYVSSGDLDLALEQPVYIMSTVPLAYGTASYISNQNAVDASNAALDDPETGAAIDAQAAANGLKLLGHTSAGASVFLSRTEIPDLATATKLTIGSPINLDLYAGYGFGTTAVEPADMYDSLSRGVCDLVAFSAGNIISQGLTEVAPHVLSQRAYFTNQIIGTNIDFWNSLDEKTQELFQEAARATGEWSVQYCDENDASLEDIAIAAGGTYYSITEEEGKEFNWRSMKAMADVLRGFSENLGCTEDMEKVIAIWTEVMEQDPF